MRRTSLIVTILLIVLTAACASKGAATPDPNAKKPSKPGDVGQAVSLKGDPANGEAIFNAKCQDCHGKEGTGGVSNGGAEAGTVPTLNPIAPSLYNEDAKVFAANLDLFIEHGSVQKDPPTGS